MPGRNFGNADDRVALGVFLAIATFAQFSTADMVVKWIGGGYSVFQIVFLTSVFALIPMLGLVIANGGIGCARPKAPVWVLARAVMLLLSTYSGYTALRFLSMAEMYTLIFTAPMMVTMLAIPFLGEKVGWRRWSAVIVGFAGVVVMLRPGTQALNFGHLAAFCGALTFAISVIIVRRHPGESGSALLAPLILLMVLVGGILVVALDAWTPMKASDVALLAAIGLLFGGAQICLIYAFRFAQAAVVAPFHYSQMIWAVIYGALVFGDWPDAYTLAGAGLIVGTGVYIVLRENRTAAAPSTATIG